MDVSQDLEKRPTSKDYVPDPTNKRLSKAWCRYTLFNTATNTFIILLNLFYFNINYHEIFTFTIQLDSIYAKNIISTIQEGLKFITYLSNDLNVYVNQTISDSNLQKIDSCYDNNQYKFNVWEFCRYDQFGQLMNCFNGQGINMISGLIQDFGYQLANLTNQPDPRKVSAKFVDVYYKSVNQLCETPPSKFASFQQQICQLQMYNGCGFLVWYLAGLQSLSIFLLFLVIIVELFFVFIQLFFDHQLNLRVIYILKLILLSCCFISFYSVFLFTLAMHIPINNMLKLYPVGNLQFEPWGFIIWNVAFIVNIAVTIRAGILQRKSLTT